MKRKLGSLIAAGMMTMGTMAQTFVPVTATGYNNDGIAEANPSLTTTTAAMDGSDYVLYSAAYGALHSSTYGLPNSGTIVSGTRTYQIPAYTGNNVLLLHQGQTDTLILTTPASYGKLSLLGCSTEGAGTNTYTVKFTDGTQTVFSSVGLNDWFNGTSPIISGFDRAGRTSGTPDFSSINPRMYANDLTLTCADQAKLVRAIVVSNVGTHPNTCIFAISGVSVSTYSIVSTNPACHGGANGRAVITASAASAVSSYTWSTTPQQLTDTASGLTAGIYHVTIANGAGCTVVLADTITDPSGSGLPVTASRDSICSGDTVVLTTTGGTSYTWSVGTSTDSTISVVPINTTVYAVTAASAAGCVGAGTHTVTVRAKPPVMITQTPNHGICIGQAVTLTVSGAQSYHWSGTVVSGAAFNPTATATYAVTGTDIHGCVDTTSIQVTVYPLPVIHITPPTAATICAGTAITLSGTGGSIYQWSNGVTDGSSFTPTATTLYKVTGVDMNGCSSKDSINIIVNPTPTVAATAAPSATICNGSPVTLTATGAATYQWSGGVSNGVAFHPTATTTYTVTGTDAKSCSATANVTVTVNTCNGIATADGDAELRAYPNPSNGTLTLQCHSAAKEMKVMVYDLQGRVVCATTYSDLQAGDLRTVNMSNVSSGMYVLQVKTDDATMTQQLSIQR